VIKEAMRLHPAVMMSLPRLIPQGGSVLCGYKIPAGTEVGMNAAVIHYNTEIYGEDAATFSPERWLDSDPETIRVMDRMLMTVCIFLSFYSFFIRERKTANSNVSPQFGRGSRDCIGKNIALMEIGKLVPQLLRKFDIEWASEKPDWEMTVWWFARQRGMITKLTEREYVSKSEQEEPRGSLQPVV
jgi:cytochrome P450